MLRFTPDQRRETAAAARAASERRIFELLRQHYAGTAVWRGDPGGVAVVRAAITKSAALAMTAERDAFKIAALMLVFGDEFETREPWAVQIVAAREGDAPIAELLHRAGVAEIRGREDAG